MLPYRYTLITRGNVMQCDPARRRLCLGPGHGRRAAHAMATHSNPMGTPIQASRHAHDRAIQVCSVGAVGEGGGAPWAEVMVLSFRAVG
ncbi:hypothetical protein GHA01_29530 [Novacetimonas hansenii]|uniref:Uncharacterized protein n=1 Tax=Novacetimonas hansenii TaxID=436 RepID=A0ABQ0SIF9_NOVHA|nr:hypothetical protein Gaha_0121_014 [Novacetimonas hansenii JCM 7643]GBQ54789.1 hypothetical protein AA0243_0717 [Novacetimonas hansenii NRIC 0243]GEC65104.1 hypothetical protein GHA01_29530 [Novacetimonas hansenii]